MRQLPLFKDETLKSHGGIVNLGKRKTRRPLATRKALHLVLKSSQTVCLFSELSEVKYYINRYSFQFHIRIYHLSVQKDHIHILMKIVNRDSYKKFTRALTGILARKYGKGLWKLSPFTRVLDWGQDFERTKNYISQNEAEVWGVRPYKPRKNKAPTYQNPLEKPL